MIADDFDNDGKLDVFVVNKTDDYSKSYAIYISNAVRSVGLPEINSRTKDITAAMQRKGISDFRTGWTVSAMASYDWDNDGYKDVIYADIRGRVWVWRFDANRDDFLNEDLIELLFHDNDIGTDAREGNAVIDLADINQDGVLDLIAGHTNKTGIFIYPGKMVNGRLRFDTSERITLITPATRTSSASLTEFLIVDPSIPNSKNPLQLVSFSPSVIKVTDVDGDGMKDIFVGTDAWRQNQSFGGSVYLFKGKTYNERSQPIFTSIELVRGNPSSGPVPYDFDAGTIADFEGDGIPDFVAADGNHSGDYYMILTRTSPEYSEAPGYLISKTMREIFGIQPEQLKNHLVKRIDVIIEFEAGSKGYFEIRYAEIPVRNPHLVDYTNYPLMSESCEPVPDSSVSYSIEFEKPLPEPQVIVVLFPSDNRKQAPAIKGITYQVQTVPAQVLIRSFIWRKGGD